MENLQQPALCLNCNRTENEVPLVALRFAQQQKWICTQCLPHLIHQPHLVADKLAGIESLNPTPQLR